MSEPLPEPMEVFIEDADGQLSIEPVENAELDFGAWVEKMPTDEQFRSLWWAWHW